MGRIAKTIFFLVLVLSQAMPFLAETILPATERTVPPLRWRTKVIPIAISTSLLRSAPNVKAGNDLIGALRRSLRAWEDAGGVEFRETFSERQNVSPQGVTGDGISLITIAPTAENSVLFGKTSDEVAATTRVFFDSKGRISEADIVLNPYQQFSTDGTFGSFDAESTFTHEIGHVLGLEHSSVRGSVMYENFGQNGLFNLQAFGNRTLAEMDRASVRAKYGAPEGDEKCCGRVFVKLSLPEGKPAAGVDVWLEDSNSGKVMAQTVTAGDGTVELTGIPFGSFTLFSGRKERTKRPVPVQEIGSLKVSANEDAFVTKRLEFTSDEIELRYTGFNGQLTLSAVPLNAGKSYTVYVGGRKLSPSTPITFSSPFLTVTPNSVVAHDYGDDITVLSFEVSVESNTPVGEYTIFATSPTGSRAAVVGGLSVRAFINPFSNFVLESKNF